MALILPDINGSEGVWGSILNTALNDLDGRLITATSANGTNAGAIQTLGNTVGDHTDDIDDLDRRVDTLEGAGGGTSGFIVGTTASLPAVTIGQITLATDTGYLSYGASIAGVATRVPFPGSWVLRLRKTNTQSMGHESINKISFNSESFDRLDGWTATASTKYVCKVPGTYEFTGGVSWQANATGYRKVSLYLDGIESNGTVTTGPAATGEVTSLNLRPTILKLAVNQEVELGALQNSTATLSSDAATGNQPTLNAKYLGYNV